MPRVHRLRQIFWPPTATRAERLAHVASTLLTLAGIIWVTLIIRFGDLWRPKTPRSPWPAIIFVVTVFMSLLLAGLIASTIHYFARRRSKRHIQSLDCRLCPRCRYDLSASPPDGACSECGRAYTDVALRALWKSAYRLTSS